MNDAYVLLTGATGFVGHHVLCEFLRRGCPCAVTLRRPIEPQVARLTRLLMPLGLDVPAAIKAGRLIPIPFDLLDDAPPDPPVPISSVLHAAASTRFEPDGSGEPTRTNVEGTRRLLGGVDEGRFFVVVPTRRGAGRQREEQDRETPHDALV